MAASPLTEIIDGDIPARFVWEDDVCVAFLSDAPLASGHTLVVPREEVDHWLDASADLRSHLFEVAHTISLGIQSAFRPAKVALLIAGLDVPHLHLDLVPIDTMAHLDLGDVDADPGAEALDAAADVIRGCLREMGATGLSERG